MHSCLADMLFADNGCVSPDGNVNWAVGDELRSQIIRTCQHESYAHYFLFLDAVYIFIHFPIKVPFCGSSVEITEGRLARGQ